MECFRLCLLEYDRCFAEDLAFYKQGLEGSIKPLACSAILACCAVFAIRVQGGAISQVDGANAICSHRVFYILYFLGRVVSWIIVLSSPECSVKWRLVDFPLHDIGIKEREISVRAKLNPAIMRP